MKNKQIFLLLSLLLVAVMLAACGGGDTPTPEEPTQAPESVMPTEAPPKRRLARSVGQLIFKISPGSGLS